MRFLWNLKRNLEWRPRRGPRPNPVRESLVMLCVMDLDLRVKRKGKTFRVRGKVIKRRAGKFKVKRTVLTEARQVPRLITVGEPVLSPNPMEGAPSVPPRLSSPGPVARSRPKPKARRGSRPC
jgi:hypothetical protein